MREPTGLGHDIVVIGASAGGVEALLDLIRALPAGFPAAVFVVLHVAPTDTGVLPRILGRDAEVVVTHAEDGDPIELGHVYVAPPDRHLLVHKDRIRVVRGPRENNYRPAIDPLFRSAALAFGSRVVGVVLSGSLDDGAAGLRTIAHSGGAAVVQDPDDALYRSMPEHAIAADEPDFVVPLAEMPQILARLTQREIEEPVADIPEVVERETAYAEMDVSTETLPPGERSIFSCPDCGGVLYELEEHGLLRYRCRIGHAYAAESLHGAQSEAIDHALATALRALEERVELSRRIARRMQAAGRERLRESYLQRAAEAERHAAELRRAIVEQSGPVEEVPG